MLGVIILLTTCNTITARAASEDIPTAETLSEKQVDRSAALLPEPDSLVVSHVPKELSQGDKFQKPLAAIDGADLTYLKEISKSFRHVVVGKAASSTPMKGVTSDKAEAIPPVAIRESHSFDGSLHPAVASSNLVEDSVVETGGDNLLGKVAAEPTTGSANPSAGRSVPVRQQAPVQRWSLNGEQYFYSWSNSLGSNGYQSVTPLTLTYKEGDWDFGVRTAYIVSGQNQSITLNGQQVATQSGAVSTLSDTSVSAAYNIRNGDMPIRLNLDLNIPTGRATLSGNEKLAIMDGSVVQQTRFGEGFNIAPGISVSKALGDRDVLGLGVSYIIRGQFDPNGDVVNDEIKPGNELVGTLQYQHVDSNWMVVGGLIYTNAGVTQRGGLDYYQKGDRLDLNLTGIYVPFDRNRVQVAARYFTQSPDSVRNFFTGNLQKESANNNGNALFLGLDWGVAIDARQQNTLHFLVDWLGVQANSYDRVNDLFNAGRDKFSVGLGYEFVASPTSRWNVQVKYFSVLDRATPITQQDITSSGLSVFATVNFSF
jgi:hypothetical protein